MTARRPSITLVGDTLNIGGTERQFVEIARRLDRSRWNLGVACIRAEGPLRGRLEEAGVRPWTCGGASFRSPRLVVSMLALARRLRLSGAEVVHSFDFYSNILAVPAARLARVPVVIASQRDLGELRPRHYQRIHSAILRLATHVSVNSEAVAQRLVGTRAARTGRLSVICNGVDVSSFAPAPAGLPAGAQTLVGTLASLHPYKGLLDLMEAAGRVRQVIPHARFAIWGDGPLRGELETRIRALGLTGTIALHGSTSEPARALRLCTMLVHPSLSEASSNAVLEAMATGLPVVATRVGGTPWLIEDGRSGLLVRAGDPKAMADAIIGVLDRPALADRLGAAARARAVAEFGMDRMLERVEALYSTTLGVGAPCPAGLVPHP